MSKAERRYFTPQEVGNLTGFSASFIRGEIKAGRIEAGYVMARKRKMGRWKIPAAAARRYAQQIGRDVIEPVRNLCGVYFVQCGPYIKVGLSHSVVRRLEYLRAAIPIPVEPLGYLPCVDGHESGQREQAVMDLFAAFRHKGEWFTDAPDIRAYIAAHATPWPVSR